MNFLSYKSFLLTTAFLVAFGSAVMACGAGDYKGGADKSGKQTTTDVN